MNKKHAYLIMTYKPNKVYTLLSQLDDELHDIYLHVDSKFSFNEEKLKSCITKGNLFIFSKYDVSWADITQTMCQIFLLEEARKKSYSYYHLLSESDFPLKSNDELYQFFEKSNKNFVHFERSRIPAEKKKYINYYYLFQKYNRHSKIFDKLEKINIFLQKLFRINRCKKNEVYACGANWFSIKENFADLIISNKEKIYKRYKRTRSSDEFYLQSLIIGTDYENHLFYDKMDDNYIACQRYIDWNRGNPYIFNKADVDELLACGFCFVRKINLEDGTGEEIKLRLKERE